MQQTVLAVFAFAVFCLATAEIVQPNCTDNKDGRRLACFSCMGRDLENCEGGLSCCKGSCFKLIDSKHALVVKGCTAKDEEDASMKVRELDIELYWANNEKVKGESYFCKGNDFCNGISHASPLLALSSALLLCLLR